jgi:glutaredoxin 3
MKPVTVYTTTYCGYCVRAKALLTELQVPFTEVDVTEDQPARDLLVKRTGQMTVPQIFIGEQSVGGFTDLRALHNAGKLSPLLAG